MLPLFIEVDVFGVTKVDENKVLFNIEQLKRTSIPIDIISLIQEEVLLLDNNSQMPVTCIFLKTGKELTVKQTYEEIQELISDSMPSHLKKESWE